MSKIKEISAVRNVNIFLNYEKLLMPHSGSVEKYSSREIFPLCSEDKADVVGFLKRMLQQRTDSITELTDRLEGMKVRMEEKQDRMEEIKAIVRKDSKDEMKSERK
jgi:hypothetical protein